MGRASKSRLLSVWMNGEHVGEWRRPATGGQEFFYADSWLSSSAARPISLSLPLRPASYVYREGVESFFDNLLPDNRYIRERIQRRFRTATIGAFDLLGEIGRDCVGALQLLPEGSAPRNIRQISGEPLTREEVGELLGKALGTNFGSKDSAEDDFRISLAGAQEKTALLLRNGEWIRPAGPTATTHILKLPLGINPQGIDLGASVENEWLCSQIVRAYGIQTANCWIETFGELKALVVERFDRRLSADGTWHIRLPQEDLCQATSTPGGLKYESDGGPGIREIMDLLLGSERPAEDRSSFMRIQLIFWMLAAIDGHAKNFSLFLLPGGGHKLTPQYDILSAYPAMGHGRGKLSPEKIRMAMAVSGKNRHYHWKQIHVRHWLETAKRCGFNGMPLIIEEAIGRTPEVIEQTRQLVPSEFPAEVADSIFKGLQQSAEQLKSEV
ncbi:MAG: type II toxin-antitoxin system HipA family toxin [Verrucomicrobiales bacterium]